MQIGEICAVPADVGGSGFVARRCSSTVERLIRNQQMECSNPPTGSDKQSPRTLAGKHGRDLNGNGCAITPG